MLSLSLAQNYLIPKRNTNDEPFMTDRILIELYESFKESKKSRVDEDVSSFLLRNLFNLFYSK